MYFIKDGCAHAKACLLRELLTYDLVSLECFTLKLTEMSTFHLGITGITTFKLEIYTFQLGVYWNNHISIQNYRNDHFFFTVSSTEIATSYSDAYTVVLLLILATKLLDLLSPATTPSPHHVVKEQHRYSPSTCGTDSTLPAKDTSSPCLQTSG